MLNVSNESRDVRGRHPRGRARLARPRRPVRSGWRVLRIAATLGLVLGAGLGSGPAAFAAWPDDKPVEVIVGFTAGGATDVMARKLGPFVEKRLGGKAKLLVVNRPGASGEIANTALARATPDGYTIGIVNVPSFLFLPLTKKAQYSPSDMRLVARVVDDPTVLVVRTGGRYGSFSDLLGALRDQPGSVSLGHNGVGTNGYLTLRLITEAAQVQANEVPYRGASAQKTDLLGGHLDAALVSAGEVPELHGGAAGELKVIAQFARTRSPALPDVPTAAEAGVPVVMSSERGYAVPKGAPEAVVQRLEAALADSVRDPEFVASLAGEASILAYLPGAQWQTVVDEDLKLLRELAERLPK